MSNTSRPWYRMKRTWVGGFVSLLIIGAAVGGNDDTKETAAAPAPTKSVTATPSPTSADDALAKIREHNKKGQDDLKDDIAKASKSAAAKEAASGKVPDVVGMTNAEAIPVLHKAGFMANEEDATGQHRWAVDNTNWKVCSQDPAPGYHPTTLRVAIYSVKLDESC